MTIGTSTVAKVDNGVNVTALLGARESLQQAPEAAQFKWRASCEWLNGTHSRSAIGNFFGLGAEQSRGKTFTVEADHPQVFASEDNAPTPVELALSGLASCLTAGIAAVAVRLDRGRRSLFSGRHGHVMAWRHPLVGVRGARVACQRPVRRKRRGRANHRVQDQCGYQQDAPGEGVESRHPAQCRSTGSGVR